MDETQERILKSWNVREELINSILNHGNTLVQSLKLVPETRSELTHERWKRIVAEELRKATSRYGNGEPLLSEQELTTLACITNPGRGW